MRRLSGFPKTFSSAFQESSQPAIPPSLINLQESSISPAWSSDREFLPSPSCASRREGFVRSESEAPRPCLRRSGFAQAGTRQGLSRNVDMITGSTLLPAPAYRQEGRASSRLARERPCNCFQMKFPALKGEACGALAGHRNTQKT